MFQPRHRSKLTDIRIFPRRTVLASGIDAWLDNLAEDFFHPLLEPDRGTARAEVADLLRPMPVGEADTWIADHVRLRFRAVLPQ